MTLLIIKAATIVALTHGMRAIGTFAGPRWGGLVLGLPASTAVVLFFLALDQGSDFATTSAYCGLLGLLAASALALGAGWGLARGWQPVLALLFGVSCYAATAVVGRAVGVLSPVAAVPLVLAGLMAFHALARRVQPRIADRERRPSRVRNLTLRTIIPVVCLLGIMQLAGRVGPVWAGLLGTFPCVLVAVLVITILEAGPAAAAKMTTAFPLGNLSMVAFVATFGMLCRPLGGTAAIGIGYVAAFATLAGVEAVRRIAARPSCAALALPTGLVRMGTARERPLKLAAA